jgi:hypothetical protein
MGNDTAAMENSMILQKIKDRIDTWSSNSTSDESRVSKKYLYTHVHSSILTMTTT